MEGGVRGGRKRGNAEKKEEKNAFPLLTERGARERTCGRFTLNNRDDPDLHLAGGSLGGRWSGGFVWESPPMLCCAVLCCGRLSWWRNPVLGTRLARA